MAEFWKPCVGYANYEVSTYGNVRSIDHSKWNGPVGFGFHKGRVLKPGIGSHGYPNVQLGKGKVRTVHSLVLETFIGPRPLGMESRHLDGNRLNARLENLEWNTPKQNGRDKITHGTAKMGGIKAAATQKRLLKMSGMFSVAEISRAGCTSPRGVRHWEGRGLLGLVERTQGDTRRYTAEQMDKARIIAAAQFGGWSLEEMGPLLDEWGPEAYAAIMTRLSDQVRAAVRLGEHLPKPTAISVDQEYDL